MTIISQGAVLQFPTATLKSVQTILHVRLSALDYREPTMTETHRTRVTLTPDRMRQFYSQPRSSSSRTKLLIIWSVSMLRVKNMVEETESSR